MATTNNNTATRVFKFSDDERTYIRFIDADSISKKYNPYGLYLKLSDEELTEKLEQYQEEFEEEKDNFENEEEFADQYEWDYNGVSFYGKPIQLVNPLEEEWTDDLSDWYNEDGTPADLEEEAEFVSEWDGSNYKETILTSEHGYCAVEEITEQYANVQDEWEHIGGYKKNNDLNWIEYYFHEATSTMWAQHNSLWQGSVTTYEILEDSERLYAIVCCIYEDSDCVSSNFVEELNDDMALKDSEKWIAKDNTLYLQTNGEEIEIDFEDIVKESEHPFYVDQESSKYLDLNPSNFRK